MSKFTDHLLTDLVREHGATLDEVERPRRVRLGRPRVLAGGSLGLAGVGAGLVLILGGGAAATPAFAITQNGDGGALVTFNTVNTGRPYLYAVDRMLNEKYGEEITVAYAPGPATVTGPVACTPTPANDTAGLPQTPVKVLLGSDGTAVIPAGTTGAGTVHLSDCEVWTVGTPGNAGNSGVG